MYLFLHVYIPTSKGIVCFLNRSCVPEAKDLRRFVSRPPPGGGRLYCTMLRHAGEPAPCYTLYLEYLGGLVPLLKGRRTSKIRPEFVIFDPQVRDIYTGTDSVSHTLSFDDSSHLSSDVHPYHPESQIYKYSDGSDTDKDTNDSCGSPKYQRRHRRRHGDKSSDENDLIYIDTLPEYAKLVEVTSNIWGTKFKIHGLTGSVPANLGQVTYRTSLLHLQPRQMTLIMPELRDDLQAGKVFHIFSGNFMSWNFPYANMYVDNCLITLNFRDFM